MLSIRNIKVFRNMNWLKILYEMWVEERPRIFYWSPVVLGIGIGAYYGWPYEPDLAKVIGAFIVVCGFWLLARHLLLPRILFLLVLGFASATLASHVYGTNMLDWPTRATRITAKIIDVEQHKSGRRLLLDDVYVEKLPLHRTPERMRLVVPRRLDKQAPELRPGQNIEAVAKVLPFSEPMTPDGFDFRRNAYFRGIGATGYLMGKIRLSEPDPPSLTGIHVWLAQLRQDLQTMIKRHLEGDKAGLAIILMTGDKTSLSPETTDSMRSIGLAHLLAIAGLHVGLVAGVVFFFVRALLALFPFIALRFPIKKWAAAMALLAIIFFTFQVGAPVPTRRALIMTSIVLLGIMLDRLSLSLRTVALAALLILLFWPQMLLHPAFQLSFAAVLGIISVGEWARKSGWQLFANRHGLVWNGLRHIMELAGMSVVATLATLPFCLYHFQEAEIYSVLANTLAIPLTSFWLMPLCVLTEFLWIFGLEEWPLKLLDPGVGLLIRLSENIANLPGAHYSPPPMPVIYMLIATFGGLFICLTQGRKRWAGLAALLVAIVLTFFEPRPSIYIGPNGKQAGWWNREEAIMVITSLEEKPDKYLAGYWGERFGYKEDRLRFVGDGETEVPPLSCNEVRCVSRYAAGTLAWMKKSEALAQECGAGHAIIINAVSRDTCPESKGVLLTRDSFYQHGAHAIFVTDEGFRIKASRDGRALRPWSVGWRPEKHKAAGFVELAGSTFSKDANSASVPEPNPEVVE